MEPPWWRRRAGRRVFNLQDLVSIWPKLSSGGGGGGRRRVERESPPARRDRRASWKWLATARDWLACSVVAVVVVVVALDCPLIVCINSPPPFSILFPPPNWSLTKWDHIKWAASWADTVPSGEHCCAWLQWNEIEAKEATVCVCVCLG